MRAYASTCKYAIIGKEVGAEGTPHLQAYFSRKSPVKFRSVKNAFPRAHIEKSRGNHAQNRAYCSKDGQCEEFGDEPKSGSRSDIQQVKRMFNEGRPIDEIVMAAQSYQAAKHVEMLFKYQQAPPCQKRRVLWFYGPTGTGKTRTAVEQSNGNFWISGKTLKWWDGYTGQETVIIDDFRKDYCTFHELLRILDRYPYKVETKGSSIYFQPTTKTIIVTSCYHPDRVYDTREDIQQLLRRIDEIFYFKDSVPVINGQTQDGQTDSEISQVHSESTLPC